MSPDQSRRLRPGHNAHFCFVDFASPEQALAALRSVRGRRATVKGSAVRVNVAFGDNGRKKERDAAELEAWRMADAAATANGAEVTATTHPPPSASEQGRNEAAES